MRLRSSLIVLAVFFAIASQAAAQGRLTGVVRDTLGAPMPGVEVTVQGVARPATTGPTGAFEFQGIKVGTVAVTMRRLGYAPQSSIVKIVAGENTLPDITLTAVPRQLDTVVTREQQLWRERPLLREFEENRKLGLGQFITRADLAKLQGSYLTQAFDSRRGLIVVRALSGGVGRAWLANKYIPNVGNCSELEDLGRSQTAPPGAACNYCFPTVYLDYTRLSSGHTVPNVSQFNPDQLEGVEIYLGAAETPMRYASGFSSCGVVVFHTRAVEAKPRVIAVKQTEPTRARFFASTSVSASARCFDCARGAAMDVALGYTLRDRWVLTGRYASWSTAYGDDQSMRLSQALVEWYPHPEPARVKWFLNAGGGLMSIDIDRQDQDVTDHFSAGALPSMVVGTGVDITLVQRLVVTPFFSFSRSMLGSAEHTRCVRTVLVDGSVEYPCYRVTNEPGTYSLRQLGARIGWR
jgi:hypothetical protein